MCHDLSDQNITFVMFTCIWALQCIHDVTPGHMINCKQVRRMCRHYSLVIALCLTNNNFGAQNKSLQVGTCCHLRSSSLLAIDIIAYRCLCWPAAMLATWAWQLYPATRGPFSIDAILGSWCSYMRMCLQPQYRSTINQMCCLLCCMSTTQWLDLTLDFCATSPDVTPLNSLVLHLQSHAC